MSRLAIVLLLGLLLAGCGGSGDRPAAEQRQVTVPGYGTFHATTEAVTMGTPADCKRAARAFTRDAVTFLVPSPTPVDLYFVAARTQFYDFQAHSCDPAYLRTALVRRLNTSKRRELVARMPFLGQVGAELR